MATVTKRQFYGQQYDFALDEHHFAGLVGGIGSGKSFAGAERAFRASQGMVGKKMIPFPNNGVVVAPTYNMLRDATLPTFEAIAGDMIVDYNKSEMHMTLRNGSEIMFRSSTEPARLRGPNLSWFWMDEGALSTGETWQILIGRLRQFGEWGYGFLTTTPAGRNWVYQEFLLEPRADYKLYRIRTKENPFIDAAYYGSLRASYADDFAAQELDGEFIAHEGLIYPEFRRHRHVVEKSTETFKYFVAGVDWGFANRGVILLAGVDYDGNIHVFYENTARQRKIEDWAATAGELASQIKELTFYADPSQPEFINQFQQAGAHTFPADNEVLPGINSVKLRLQSEFNATPRLTVDPSCVYTIAEFESYAWMSNVNGMKDAPKKSNDHCMDGLRYLVRAVDSGFGDPAMAQAGGMSFDDYSIGLGNY